MTKFRWLAFCLVLLTGSAARAEWPWTLEGPRRGTPEYNAMMADQPVGQRQKMRAGKLWPPFARPCGPEVPCAHKYYHNHFWPYPYTEADQASVRSYIDIQIQNGWTDAVTLYDYHFDPDTQRLNRAGQEHLYWILSSAPVQHRSVYVANSRDDANFNNVRLASVQEDCARLVGADQIPPVMLRVATAKGTPGTTVNSVWKYRIDNLSPPPTVQYSGAPSVSGN